jgi:hypothetical protein
MLKSLLTDVRVWKNIGKSLAIGAVCATTIKLCSDAITTTDVTKWFAEYDFIPYDHSIAHPLSEIYKYMSIIYPNDARELMQPLLTSCEYIILVSVGVDNGLISDGHYIYQVFRNVQKIHNIIEIFQGLNIKPPILKEDIMTQCGVLKEAVEDLSTNTRQGLNRKCTMLLPPSPMEQNEMNLQGQSHAIGKRRQHRHHRHHRRSITSHDLQTRDSRQQQKQEQKQEHGHGHKLQNDKFHNQDKQHDPVKQEPMRELEQESEQEIHEEEQEIHEEEQTQDQTSIEEHHQDDEEREGDEEGDEKDLPYPGTDIDVVSESVLPDSPPDTDVCSFDEGDENPL